MEYNSDDSKCSLRVKRTALRSKPLKYRKRSSSLPPPGPKYRSKKSKLRTIATKYEESVTCLPLVNLVESTSINKKL